MIKPSIRKHDSFNSHPLGWPLQKTKQNKQKLEPLHTVGGTVNGAAAVETNMVFLEKLKILPYGAAISFLGIYSKESQIAICTSMCIAALFTAARRWQQPKCPLTHEWINKIWYIRKMEYYLALKRKEILTCATIWMNLEDIMPSERSQ